MLKIVLLHSISKTLRPNEGFSYFYDEFQINVINLKYCHSGNFYEKRQYHGGLLCPNGVGSPSCRRYYNDTKRKTICLTVKAVS